MKRWIAIQATCLFSLISCFSFANYFEDSSVELGLGYRQDNFSWSISVPPIPEVGFPGADPLSRLKWKDLKIGYWALRAQTTTCEHMYLRGEFDYGSIWDGKVRDSDFLGLDETNFEFSRSTSDADKGRVFDLSGGIGYQLSFFCDTLKIIPIVGYSLNEQHLRMFNTRQNFLFGFNDSGSLIEFDSFKNRVFHGIHSNYRARWYGPWIGVDFAYQFCPYTFVGYLEYHWSRYRGKGHWNAREEFVKDFRQVSDAHGVVGMLGAYFDYSKCLNFGLRTNYTYFRGQKGKDVTSIDLNKVNPEQFPTSKIVTTRIPFNGARWYSFRIEGIIAYKF